MGEWPRQRTAATHPEFPESGLCLGLDRAAGMGIEDERCNRRAHLEGWQGQISSPTQGAEQMHREETGNDANAALLRARGDPKRSLAGETGDGQPQKKCKENLKQRQTHQGRHQGRHIGEQGEPGRFSGAKARCP